MWQVITNARLIFVSKTLNFNRCVKPHRVMRQKGKLPQHITTQPRGPTKTGWLTLKTNNTVIYTDSDSQQPEPNARKNCGHLSGVIKLNLSRHAGDLQ